MNENSMIKKDKTLYIIAGANGSGKTTFALSYTALNRLHFINADEIAKSYDPNDISKYKVKAGKEFFRQLEASLDGEKSFMIESTNILRVKNRVLNGGHDVPEDDIKRRYTRSKNLFWNTYKHMADNWMLFFNGDDDYEIVANQDNIFVEYLYENFLKDIK
ncbi:MAG: hypothetical protein ACLFOC_09985 [Campylobacterales bacterium]